VLDVNSALGPAARGAAPQVSVDPAWLQWIPAAGMMGVVSMVLAPEAAAWDSAFALADRVDRADPSHKDTAPVRARLNLLAAGVGARLEADLWPHLRGLTACVMGDPEQPGKPTGALAVLHTDSANSAERIARDVLPRMGRLLRGQREPEPAAGKPASGHLLRIGVAGGKALRVLRRGSDVLVAWGDGVLAQSLEVSQQPDRSVAPLCTAWAKAGKRGPRRVGAFWPARCWSPARGSDAPSPAWRALADGPPAVWWGWDEANSLRDTLVYSDLREATRRFLDAVPLDPPPLP
jgi:hypothetical protein